MAGVGGPGALLLCALLLPFAQLSAQVPDCQEVRSSFQLLHPGMKWAPESPVSGADLQVCQYKGLSCCSRKMEERYQAVARQNMESNLQAASAQLKLLIMQNAAVFQEAFEMVLRHGHNSTQTMLRAEFPGLGGGTNTAVGQLFLDISFYSMGSDVSVDDMVTAFFSRLFPATYGRLLGGGTGTATAVWVECLRGAWVQTGAFGSYPKLMMTRLARSLPATRTFLQALNLGIEVVNTTQHLRPGRDCARALLRLWLCPRCLGLSSAPPCPTLCPTLMQGCLGGAAQVQPHWQAYVEGLAALAKAMRSERDAEDAMLRLHAVVRLALRHALSSRSRLLAAVSATCSRATHRVSRSASPPAGRSPPAPDRHVPQLVPFDPEETLAGRRREFIASLQGFNTFYGSLGETLCSKETPALNGSHCWNGQEMTARLSGSGGKRVQQNSPEPKQKAPEPVISQIIDKLKHINQLLRQVTGPVRRWKPAGGDAEQGGETRGREDDGGMSESGDCDDEDECGDVSGMGPPPLQNRLRIFADLADSLAMDDLTFHEQLLTPEVATDTEGGLAVPGRVGTLRALGGIVPVASILAVLAILLGHP
ncbi:glypican-3 [Paramormyrops kingsleyae]|uniref:Glypican-3 n=1 Tax=Paramormyrops kingsleyae TaxID=1676925 RepID=A0A3B3QC88_9TELE|nr:glypican-3-like [Paramormyrops kingsleyae]